MEKFKERKIVIVLHGILLILLPIVFISLVLSMFNLMFLYGVLLFIPMVVISIIGLVFSKQNSYTVEFLEYISNKHNECRTLADLINLCNEFEELAMDKDRNRYILSYPNDLRRIHSNILSNIEFLLKNKSNETDENN
jgi:hypothetical protein